MRKINPSSDFDLVIDIKDVNGKSIGFPTCPFQIIFSTPTSSNAYYVYYNSEDDHEFCANDNGKIRVFFQDHQLGYGRICMQFEMWLPDERYPNGQRHIVEHQHLDVELSTESSVGGEYHAETEVTLALYRGEDGTSMTFETLTPEQISELQRPAVDAAQTLIEAYTAETQAGKARLAEALNDAGIPTEASESLSRMVDKVSTLPKATTEGPLGPISCTVVGNELIIEGGGKYARKGYVPYVFRLLTKNRNSQYEDGSRCYLTRRRGWNVYGSYAAVDIRGGVFHFVKYTDAWVEQNRESGRDLPLIQSVLADRTAMKEFRTNSARFEFTSDPAALMNFAVSNPYAENPDTYVTWGRRCVNNYAYPKFRTLSFRFGLAYGPKIEPGRRRIRLCDMVSNLVEFETVLTPREMYMNQSYNEPLPPGVCGRWSFRAL